MGAIGVAIVVHECPSSSGETPGKHVNGDGREHAKKRYQDNHDANVHRGHTYQLLARKAQRGFCALVEPATSGPP
jgi:hypothetical protein